DAAYFDRETFGVDRLVRRKAEAFPAVVNGSGGPAITAEFLAQTPLAEHVRADLLRLHNDEPDYLPALSIPHNATKLKPTSYRHHLLNMVKVPPGGLHFYHPDGPAGLTTDTTSAWYFFNRGSAGFDGLGVPLAPDAPSELDRTRPDKREPSQFHFP